MYKEGHLLPLMILDRVKLDEEKLNGFTPSQKRHVRQGLSDLRYVRILRTSHEVFIAKTGEFSFVASTCSCRKSGKCYYFLLLF